LSFFGKIFDFFQFEPKTKHKLFLNRISEKNLHLKKTCIFTFFTLTFHKGQNLYLHSQYYFKHIKKN